MLILKNFLTQEEQPQIIQYAKSINPCTSIENEHIKKINDQINGFSVLCDLTQTEVSKSVAKFQGDNTQIESVPDLFYEIKNRICSLCDITDKNVFFQLISMKKGGRVAPHYDAACPGYITYKCNVVVKGPPTDVIYVDKYPNTIEELSLYCFEASLYKHWADACEYDRILLSYGFLLPYRELLWDEDSPRVRLSNRIWKKFQ
jgi:hypothetical protein